MNKKKLKTAICYSSIISLFILCGCSYGVRFTDNCGNLEKQTITVLPFTNDDYNCYENVERMLEKMCYQVVDGRTLVNEYCFSSGVELENVLLEKFIIFASNRGVDKIVYGDVHIEWIEGRKVSQNNVANANREPNDDYNVSRLIEGNYAIVNCECIDTKTGQKSRVLDNYLVKKVPLGMPEFKKGSTAL